MKASIYKTVGIGRVADNKPLGSKEVSVVPLEWMAFHDGEMKSDPTVMEFTSTSPSGVVSSGAAITDMTITATWIPSGSNRLTAPDVRRGERVELLTVGDSDQYYWRPTGLDDNLRKLETIVIGISATDDESDTELRPDNMYWIEFSTHSKKLAFSSSKAGGEPFLYEFYFDMEKGEVCLTDDIGNFFRLVSSLSLLQLKNSKGVSVELNGKDLLLDVTRDLVASIARDVTITAGRDATLSAGRRSVIKGGSSYMSIDSSGTTLKTPTFKGIR